MNRDNQQSSSDDSDYPMYRLEPFLVSERSFLSLHGEVSPEKERAFTIANKAISAIEMHHFDQAEQMAFHALSLDPECIDAWRVLCKCLLPLCDGDTVVCAIREAINFARRTDEVKETLMSDPGRFYQISNTRPYIRLLTDLGMTAFESEKLDLSIKAFEEIIRLNHNDNTGARDPLLACYIKLLGRIRKFPDTQPVRTFDQVRAFIHLKFGEDGIFEDDNLTIRWFNIIDAYANQKNWKKLAQAEFQRSDIMFKVIFNELEINSIPAANPIGFVMGDDQDDVRARGSMIKAALLDWPQFMLDLYKFIKKTTNHNFIEYVRENAPDPAFEKRQESRNNMIKIGNHYLEQARDALRTGNYLQTIQNCTLAKRGFFEAAVPSQRFYLHEPSPVISNRATAAFNLKKWNLARIDIRYTLVMKPDHDKSYLKIPSVIRAFNANQLIPDIQSIITDIKENPNKAPEEWQRIARVAIGLLSIPALVLAAQNKLTDLEKERLIQLGIDDMYTPVNFSSEFCPVLPYLQESDLDKLPEVN